MANTESVDIKIYGQGAHGAALICHDHVQHHDCYGITNNSK